SASLSFYASFFFPCYPHPRDLHSFPTRRSSDLDRLRAIPGVRSASVSSITPVCHCRFAGEVVIEGYAPKSRDDSMASFNNVSDRSEEHTSELQSPYDLVCRLLLEKKKEKMRYNI